MDERTHVQVTPIYPLLNLVNGCIMNYLVCTVSLLMTAAIVDLTWSSTVVAITTVTRVTFTHDTTIATTGTHSITMTTTVFVTTTRHVCKCDIKTVVNSKWTDRLFQVKGQIHFFFKLLYNLYTFLQYIHTFSAKKFIIISDSRNWYASSGHTVTCSCHTFWFDFLFCYLFCIFSQYLVWTLWFQ